MKYQSDKDIDKKRFTFRHCLRLIFTLFSLYLMGDAFYRWDAFKIYSSFSEYLPNVALASIIWSIVALLCSILVWLSLKALEQVCKYSGLKIKVEHLVLYLFAAILMAALAWTGKKIIWSDIELPHQWKLTVIGLVSFMAIPMAWLFRSKAGLWINALQDRITPLLWLFAICVMLSFPIAGFHMWGKNTSKVISQGRTKSTASEPDKKRPNILLITFDAMTARDMSAYGYHLETTPFIDKWANTASLFKRTEAGSNHTASAVPGLMTGKRVWTHRKYQFDLAAKPFKSDTENLALVMKENGYYNSAFIQNIVASVEATGISGSIDIDPLVTEFSSPASIESIIEKYLYLLFGNKFTTYNWIGQEDFIFTVLLRKIPQKVFMTEYPPELVFNKFLKVMDNNPREPFFAWIHVLPPHAPELPPPPFAGTFNTSSELREQNIQLGARPAFVRYSSKNLPFPEEVNRQIKLLRDYYDEFILYCDKQFENFIGELQNRHWSKNTIIILSSDHGDSFEHNYFLHSKSHLYEQVTHIPLIIKEPDQTRGHIIDDIVEQIDIPATILDLADIPVPSWMEGRSLLPLLRDKKLADKTAISMNLERNAPADVITKGSVAVWEGEYKLIHYLDNKKSLLFNLKKDPDELNNLFDEEPVVGQQMLTLIQNNLKQANEKIMAGKQQNIIRR
jgi:arylsulfatase A-like enzyme